MTFSKLFKKLTVPRRILEREDAIEYCGNEQILKELEALHGLKPIRALKTSKQYDIRDLDTAIERMKAANATPAPAQ